jgi:hypothetical protein
VFGQRRHHLRGFADEHDVQGIAGRGAFGIGHGGGELLKAGA